MANYYGTARSNYFRVKHDKFFELCMDVLGQNYDSLTDENGDKHYSIQPETNPDDSSFDNFMSLDEGSIEVSIKFDDFRETIVVSKKMLDGSLPDDKAVNKLFNNYGIPSDAIVKVSKFDETFIRFDLFQKISTHLVKDSVAIFLETGAEKMRFLIGTAVAVNHKGEVVTISVNNIYDMAAKKFGIEEDSIATCEYKNHVVKKTANKFVCDNCGFEGQENEFEAFGDIVNLSRRLAPGDRVPHAECRECGFFAFPKKKPYFVALSIEVLDGTSQDIFDSRHEDIAEFVIEAETEEEAVDKGKSLRTIYLDSFPDSGNPINDIDNIHVCAESISDIETKGRKDYKNAKREFERCD